MPIVSNVISVGIIRANNLVVFVRQTKVLMSIQLTYEI